MYLPDSWIDTKGSVGARPTDQYGHRKITLSLRGSFLSIVFILYYILNLTQFSNAQSPTYVSHMAYAFIDGKALYIQGGHTNEANSSQIFALDLSKMDWSTDNPPWIELNAGSGAQLSPVDYEHSMTIAPDQQGLVIWGFNSGISKYNLMTNAWNITLISQPDPAFPSMGTESVANPRTGLIYKLGPTKSGQAIIAFNPNSNAATTNLVPSFLYGELRYHSLTWSTSRSSALLYGGYFVPSERFNTDFLEYRPDADTWSFLTTSGTGPGPLVSHCMVPAYNGSKMIVFGGQGTDRSPLGSIYVLDIPSMTWSKGVDVKSNLYRNNMACAVSGNYFVAVGGQQDASYNEELLKPILYDIRADEWVYPVVPPAPPKSKLPIIIGCSVAGGVLLIVGIGICCSRCCKTKKSPVSVPKVAEVKSNDTRDIETATVRSEMSDRDHLSFGTGNEPHNGPWSVDNRSTSNSRSIQDQLSMPMRSRHARGNWSVNDRDTTETDSTQDGLSVPSENRRLRGSTGDGSEWSINGLDTIDEAPSRGLALSPLREEYIDDALSIGESMDLDVDNGPINHEDVVLDDLNPPPAYEVDSNTVNAL